ncbi:MAG: 3-deoxy-manno-octulosonate cytidylyltransferase [Methylococcales bacterium]|nr:3-deoxy-manno-octulosonate cytidylyltransferase [Methylococcales bacterium]
MTQSFKVVIPARHGSTRLPGKPLRLLAGKPMIAHVCERAVAAGADEVLVATDDARIVQAVKDTGHQAMMTDAGHRSGTDRIAEVARRMAWPDDTVIVNLQGDEPLLAGAYIEAAALCLNSQSKARVATLAAPVQHRDELFNANAVKVVLDKDDYALYFSRAPIPWDRDRFPDRASLDGYWRHIGLYAYTAGFLEEYQHWPKAPIEALEALEQLRILWQGEAIRVRTVKTAPPPGVDTEEDLLKVQAILEAK